ncbi:hypothetical protein [Colwellia sp. Arc7-635]|uniref:hypothetical protein n=1 Tax=Colwellia sp. Arc7-635 TaxID=2497879 RepID=UPI0013DF0265|nr:hypothetical protein [Colwellia sp. Arc7-635]
MIKSQNISRLSHHFAFNMFTISNIRSAIHSVARIGLSVDTDTMKIQLIAIITHCYQT